MDIECEVLVAGGGSAGMAAALAAGRMGAQVVLLERHGFLGGMGTAALVHTICGLYLLREEEGAVEANPGLATEVAGRLLAMGGAHGPVRMGRVDVLPHDPWALALLADDMVTECRELRVLLHTEICEVNGNDGGWEVIAVSRGTRLRVRAQALVDATGDATVTALAGAPWRQEQAGCLQRPAYVFKLAGVKSGMLGDEARLRLAHGLAFAVRAGELPPEALGTGLRAGLNPGECFVTVDLAAGGEAYDPLDVALLSNLERLGRRTARELHGWLRRKQPGFEECTVAAWPVRAGVRESRRMLGRYELSAADVLEGKRFEDGIAQVAWPLELRDRATGPRWQFPRPRVAAAQIPLRCLQSVRFASLFAAGRCLSASHEALAAVRVMGTCLATGEAAGRAAAGVAMKTQKQIEVDKPGRIR